MSDRYTAKLSPVEEHGGILVKREDSYAYPNGVNGSKLRACEVLVRQARQRGYDTLVSAAACISPQSAIASSVAAKMGMDAHVIVGGTTAEKAAAAHTSIALAKAAGASISSISVGYNPALQKAARDMAEAMGWYHLPYGIAPTQDADLHSIQQFHQVAADQVENLRGSNTLVLPFGSGNTGAGVLWGLTQYETDIENIELMVIGPNKMNWLKQRLAQLGTSWAELNSMYRITIHELHPTFATYGDRMPEKLGSLVLHPTYEGKVVRYLNQTMPGFWMLDDALLWCVGGPLPRQKGFTS